MGEEFINKNYMAKAVEQKWYRFWEDRGLFTADNKSPKTKFSMAMPPPNITAKLHMGHALDLTVPDVLVRWRRMQGDNTLWVPGTDHASIATHYMIEKELAKENLTRFDFGREKFLEKAWKWKEQYGGLITLQMRRLGISCDWSRERFTMDEGLSRAVREAFVRLYDQGLIYRGEYIVNWCPRCRTAISDLEVIYEPYQGKLYYINYPIKDSTEFITIATTRPETMLGDTAVAVHPADERYTSLHGRIAILPNVKRELPILADEFVDPEFGTGAVKITPAHDPADFQIGQKYGLTRVVVIDEAGVMTDEAGEFAGMDRFKCREKLVQRLHKQGALAKIDDYTYNLGHCQRCHTVVEPRVSTQWFVKIKPLAEKAIKAVESGRIRFVPESFAKIYFEWMYNIRDWCISRQLWWGHRIPVCYCKSCRRDNVAREAVTSCSHCGSTELEQDPDILDTWFSSGLWPFSTLGWPDQTDDLKTFYPTDVMITGPDIIFFWVARMIMLGIHLTGQVPFYTVHLHGIVRDAQKQKMSKTKGNVIDPLEIIDKYGADAVRFTLAAMAVPGSDIPFSTDRMKGYSAFANKIWNAARFTQMNLPADQPWVSPLEINRLLETNKESLALYDRWILSRLNKTIQLVNEALEKFRFNDAANQVYQFFWHEFCDWYIEMSKPRITAKHSNQEGREPSLKILVHLFDYSLRLLHPLMPFISEEIWQKLPHDGESLVTAEFPRVFDLRSDSEAEDQMKLLMELITKIRSIRAEANLNPGQTIPVDLIVRNEPQADLIRTNRSHLANLARLSAIGFVDQFSPDKFSLKGVAADIEFALLLDKVVDPNTERERVSKELAKTESELEKISKKLNNQDFLTRAPEEVIEESRSRHTELLGKLEKLRAYHSKLNGDKK